jgi:predicted esterase
MAAFAFAGLTHDDIRDLVHLAGASYADNDAPDGWDVLTGPALHGNSVRTAEMDLLLKQMPGDTYDVELENSSLDAAARVFVDTASDAPRIALSFRGTDDWVDFDGGDWRANLGLLLNGRYIENFEPLLDQVRAYAQRNGIDSSNIFVTGHSLGGAAANQLYQRDDIEDGFFQQSRFFTLATPLVAADKGTDNILNVAMDNDKVFAITHEVSEVLQEESKFDQLAVMVPSLSSVPMSFYTFFLESLAQEEGNFESATDNILSVFPPQAGVFSNPASEGFREEHSTTTYEYVVESIIDSFYYDITVRDDFIAVLMSPETNIATRVALGGAAEAERLFIVGNEHPNIVFAGSQELFVDGGSGLDEVRFSGAEADYALRQNADTSVDVIGVSDTTSGSTVQLYDVERLVFADTEIELPEPGFDGGTVRLSVASPTVDTVMFSIEAETTDGNVEFPVLPRNATAANAIVETQIDLVGNIIDFDFFANEWRTICVGA